MTGDFRDDPAFLRDEAIRQAALATGAMREADDLRQQLAGAVEAGNALFAVLDGVWSGKDGGYDQAAVEAVMEQWLDATLGGQ